MIRGQVVRVDLPRPRGVAGREQFGLRPAVVIQDEPRLASLSTVLIVPLTSNLSAKRFVGSVRLFPSSENGLSVESMALTQQMRAIDRQRIQDTVGEVSAEDLASLEDSIRQLIKL